MTRKSLSILPGTVEFLAIGALARGGRMHGFEILRWVKDSSEGDLLVEEGALYPALHRMEKRSWIEADWAVSDKGRRAKYYSITTLGRDALVKETQTWDRYVTAVARVVAGPRVAGPLTTGPVSTPRSETERDSQ